MKLFTADIDKKLFAQYLKGSDLANQVVVAKIFNPYGRGTWYLLNSDPEDPEYLWAIVDLGDIEVGSVNRSDLENIRIKPFMLGLERDLSFTPMNAAEIYRGLNSGKTYAKGGVTMAHPKSYYQNLPSYSGYKWVGFDKGKHIFQKKEAKGYSVIEALESDLTNGNIEFMAEHGLTNTNKKAEGGAIYKHKHMDATAKILEKTNKGYKVEFTDNSVRKPKAKIMYFNDIDFDKEKGYFEKMETGGGVGEKYAVSGVKKSDDSVVIISTHKNFKTAQSAADKFFNKFGFGEYESIRVRKLSDSYKPYALGGGIENYQLEDVVDFNYGRADERKVLSGTITDILTDGYTISTGFKQVLVEPKDIIGYTKKEEPKKKRFGIFADGGGVQSFKKGNKVRTREGKIETIVRKNKNGNYETQESDYTWNPSDLTLVSKMATGGGITKKEFIAKKVEKVMNEFKKGDLHSGKSGKIVKNPKQAIAIALSEGKRGWKHKK